MFALLDGHHIKTITAQQIEGSVYLDDAFAEVLMADPFLLREYKYNPATKSFMKSVRPSLGTSLYAWPKLSIDEMDYSSNWYATVQIKDGSVQITVNDDLYKTCEGFNLWATTPSNIVDLVFSQKLETSLHAIKYELLDFYSMSITELSVYHLV